jgi:hypothetical protein
MEEDAATNPEKLLPPSRTTAKRPSVGNSTAPNCGWTPELDELLRTVWNCGGLLVDEHALRQLLPTWSRHSIERRAAELGLKRPKPRRWTEIEINKLLLSIDSCNAGLPLIAKRLGRSPAAVRRKLWELGYTAESLGGYKVKEVAEMLSVPPRRVQFWVQEKQLLTRGGRITESSFSAFLGSHPEKIPFEKLPSDMQSWLREMGYPSPGEGMSITRAVITSVRGSTHLQPRATHRRLDKTAGKP